jgi:Tol biopolymer transport system component
MAFGWRLFAFAPAWLWLFWLAGALVVAAGFWRGDEEEPRFLVATGLALEIWRGAERESTLFKFDDGTGIFEAVLSPDGSRIAMLTTTPPVKDADYGVDLYVVDINGANPRLVLRHSRTGEYLESLLWLPEGKDVAYAIYTPSGGDSLDRRIEVLNLETGRRRRLVSEAEKPALMPGGIQLIVVATDQRPGSTGFKPALVDLTTGQMSDLPRFALFLTYLGSFTPSPDGLHIAFSGADPSVAAPSTGGLRATAAPGARHPILQDIWLMDSDGGNLRKIADLAVNLPSLAWTQNGEFLYAMASRGFWRIDPRTATYRQIGPLLPNSGRIVALPGR